MRNIIKFNTKWAFTKQADKAPETMPENWNWVNLPHTWNNIDGLDGNNDYYRNTCFYANIIKKNELPKAENYYLEINGANSSADVYINGKNLMHHDGGYSTFRVDLTDVLTDETLVVIAVDNSQNDKVYPQMADFTFYGGLYRDVNIICVNKTHFELGHFGGSGLKVTPDVSGKTVFESWIVNKTDSQTVRYSIKNAAGETVASVETKDLSAELNVNDVHLWHGRKDPYLYTAIAEIIENGEVIDSVSHRIGYRSYEIDAERGFILNGEEYPLRGVSRHQDRIGVGNALNEADHIEDMDLICEMGANTIRLAHYQHDQFFYDLCDERGMVVWVEIPYISRHMPNGRENTISQMKELITQNYHHASIVVWGLSNEITIGGENDEDLLENHRILNDLCHEMDKTRKTVIAAVSMCSINNPYLQIPDVVSYNHYFGWYGGDTDMNGPWFDNFHKTHPNIPIGCSEYGCEALNWHTSDPKQGDYTEEYQAYYHEELIKQFFSRKYMWATHVWNMFDFGADGRNEGGENGQNHKGLVTIDRKYKKDAFYAYKAWLSDEPFVHICGKRYIDRVEDVTKVTVYSNQETVELFANGVSLGKKKADDHFFYFDVSNKGETTLKAIAGECEDNSFIRKVEVFNEAYRLKEQNAILNWFDVTEKEGFYSVNDKISDIMKSEQGQVLIKNMLSKFMTMAPKNDEASSEGFMKMLGGFTVLRLTGLMGTLESKDTPKLTKEYLLDLNDKLNNINRI